MKNQLMQLWRLIVEGGYLSQPWFDEDSRAEFFLLDAIIVGFQHDLFE